MFQEDIPLLIEAYLASLSTKDKQGLDIARDHLGMSFQIEKSVGFQTFCKKMTEEQKQQQQPPNSSKTCSSDATPSASS